VSLLSRKYGTQEWHQLPVTFRKSDFSGYYPSGYIFSSDLSTTTQFDSAGIDLKLHIEDVYGNITEMSLVPAFSVGSFHPTAVEGDRNISLSIPCVFALYQNYPNPFNPSTTIEFDIPQASFATLEVFNLLGQKVATVLSGNLKAGKHKIPWNAGSLSSGIYFYRLNSGSFSDIKKLLLLK
jgi:hypothetical protein